MKALAVVLLLTTQARADHPVDCETVRAQVAEHGRVRAYLWARSQGLSHAEISRIRKQCGI